MSIREACEKAGIPPWTPHAIRHRVATQIVDQMGTETAMRLLGHSGLAMTRHYSQQADAAAIAAVEQLGQRLG